MKDATKLFVGNLDEQATEEEVQNLFEKFGPVVECAVMKQYAFVHMRGEDAAKKAIEELNGHTLREKAILVELSKPWPVNTWKLFVGNLSLDCEASDVREVFETCGRVLECDIVNDNAVLTANYAFVHMETEAAARAAIDTLNKKKLKGKRLSVQMSTKSSKPMTNGSLGPKRIRKAYGLRKPPLNRSQPYNRKRAPDANRPFNAVKSQHDRFSGGNARFDFKNTTRPAPHDFPRDRNALRRSPTRPSNVFGQSTDTFASRLRAPGPGYGSFSSFGNLPTSSLSAPYNRPSLSTDYGANASTLSSTYRNQSLYDSKFSDYDKETRPSYGSQSSAYSTEGSTMFGNYGSRLPSAAESYSSKISTVSYPSHSQYTSSAALSSDYRPPQKSFYETSQKAGLGMQSAYSSMSSSVDTPLYERMRLSPPRSSASDSYKTMDSYKKLTSVSRYPDLADYHNPTQERADPFRRSPPKSQLDLKPQSNFPSYLELIRGSSIYGYRQRL